MSPAPPPAKQPLSQPIATSGCTTMIGCTAVCLVNGYFRVLRISYRIMYSGRRLGQASGECIPKFCPPSRPVWKCGKTFRGTSSSTVHKKTSVVIDGNFEYLGQTL